MQLAPQTSPGFSKAAEGDKARRHSASDREAERLLSFEIAFRRRDLKRLDSR